MTTKQREEVEFLSAFAQCYASPEEIDEFLRYTSRGGEKPQQNRLWDAKRDITIMLKEWCAGIREGTFFVWELEGYPYTMPYAQRHVMPVLKDAQEKTWRLSGKNSPPSNLT